MKPGVYQITNEEYHASEGLSSSHCKPLLKSAAAYKAWLEAEKKETPEMVIGSAVHTLVLEPHLFEATYHHCQVDDKRARAYGKAQEDHPDKIILTDPQWQTVHAAADSVNKTIESSPLFKELFEGLKEQSFYWTDPETGVLCKVRPDVLNKKGIITDLKTTRDASFDSFQKSIVDYMYFLSAAFYLDGVKLTLEQCEPNETNSGITWPTAFCLVAVETSAPYDVVIYYLDAQSIELGRKMYQKALKLYAKCKETGDWPGLAKEFTQIGLPNWAMYKFNKS